MNQDSLRDYCLSFPDATENVQWGADLVFKIGGKMFAATCLEPGDEKVSFKCTPEVFAELLEVDGIEPAAYAARYHWVTLISWDALPDREIRRLVRSSYDLVRAKLPGRKAAKTSRAAAAARKQAPAGGRGRPPVRRPR